jgi:hypothetical protein
MDGQSEVIGWVIGDWLKKEVALKWALNSRAKRQGCGWISKCD